MVIKSDTCCEVLGDFFWGEEGYGDHEEGGSGINLKAE